MACPYFIPDELCAHEPWPHRQRLPLGDGFAGRCGAQLPQPRCDDHSLRLHCNLGYANVGYANLGYPEIANPAPADPNLGAAPCPHLPAQRDFDAVRFTVQSKSSALLRVQFACERAHLPALSGELLYDRASMAWQPPPDARRAPAAGSGEVALPHRLLPLAQAAVRAWIARNEPPQAQSCGALIGIKSREAQPESTSSPRGEEHGII